MCDQVYTTPYYLTPMCDNKSLLVISLGNQQEGYMANYNKILGLDMKIKHEQRRWNLPKKYSIRL
jgi:hypothetical protein